MSYDYNDLLSKIRTLRSLSEEVSSQTKASQVKAIEETLDVFATLSTKCPMTPLLWMQYAHDAGRVLILTLNPDEDGTGTDNTDTNATAAAAACAACDVSSQILELGIAEFPSCAMLRLFHLDSLVAKCNLMNNNDDNDYNDDNCDEVKRIWNDIADTVCLGCHGGNDEAIILALFNVYTHFLLKVQMKVEPSEVAVEIAKLFKKRGEIYMKFGGNDAMKSEMDLLSQEYSCANDGMNGNGNGILFTESDYLDIERARQFASQHLSFLGDLEDDVLIAMQADGVASPPDLDVYSVEKDKSDGGSNYRGYLYDWHNILKAMDKSTTYLMGYGMMQTSTSFAKYIQAILNKIRHLRKIIKQSEDANKNDNNDDDDDDLEKTHKMDESQYLLDKLNNMMVQIFERGAAECPTVEIMWEKYIKHLFFILHDTPDKKAASAVVAQTFNHVKNVTSRAVRNCPYSVKLFQSKMTVIQEEVKSGRKVLEPDELIAIVNEATEGKFLPSPESNVEVYMAAIRVVKQRILNIVSCATSSMDFDETEHIEKNRGKKRKREELSSISRINRYNTALDEEINEEVSDLIEDLREMYDAADKFVRSNFKESTDLREKLFRDRANTESCICIPLSSSNVSNAFDQSVGHYEKMLKIHQPAHPDSWKSYIRFLMTSNFVTQDNGHASTNTARDDDSSSQSAGTVAAKFRYIRNLYQQSMACTKKDKIRQAESSQLDPNYVGSYKVLCQDFLDFEDNFGSQTSQTLAKKLVREKLSLINVAPSEVHMHEGKLTGEQSKEEPVAPEQPIEPSEKTVVEPSPGEHVSDVNIVPDQTSSESKTETQSHKVKVGKLTYPAHPFTVHVSNLSPLTEDMDLYDLFRPKCGAIVHARIFREKAYSTTGHDQKPESKCAGLIQFEERASVEKAIQLDGELGLNEKLIKIARSHQPAVGVVPPGMHRVQPKGDGKSTKRNQKRKERRQNGYNKDAGRTHNNANNTDNVGNLDSFTRVAVQKDSNKRRQGEASLAPSEKNGDKSVYINRTSSKAGILTFRPRGVKKQRKPKVMIAKDSNS
mmetsp:Transcript_5733/g.8607  ORF Transcript_5733/g.8607 Transcript_5733/m.8607 type:complete len:1054 (+) Transcript_5733:225-3386(+)